MSVKNVSEDSRPYPSLVLPGSEAKPERPSADAETTGPRRPLRVLVLVAAATIEAGPVKGCVQFIRHMQGRDIEFYLVNFCKGETDPNVRAFSEAAAAAGIRMEFVNQRGRGYIGLARALDAIVRREGIDLVQSHGFKPAAMCAWLRLRRGLPWVCFCHGVTAENWRVRCYHLTEQIVRVVAHRIVLVAEAQRRGVLARLVRRRTRVIHNAVDVASPTKMSLPGSVDVRQMLGLRTDDRLVVAVGRLSPEKGLDVLIDALALNTDPPGQCLHVALIGDGPERTRLAERVRRLHLQHRVHLVGHTTMPGDYLMAADLVVLPSRSEGIANVALEAMALGRPLVATAVGGTPEVVPDGVAGVLVPPEDPAALAAAMLRVLSDNTLARRLGTGARLHAATELSVDARCTRLRDVYAELMPKLRVTTTKEHLREH
ncbi:glycosyltransferase family 4 protein [Halofilum ochraceum]|uniref:glycosyltransferase family 4 protein n=1 Tax=Halofilum ochraceum TaxID=1611323 RepID=UPI000A7C6D8D|nr:glycosyltransferase family 4 protein [Halofilum ochraceum]